jgi:alpha-L-rhamnosidase
VVEVGSGLHDWTVDLPEPEVVRPPVDLDSPMSVVADDDEARTLLLQACADAGYAMAAAWSDQGRWRSDTSVRNSLLMISPRALEAVERALAELPDRRTPVLPRTE